MEIHECHRVDVVVSVRLSPEESLLLSELAEHDGSDPVETIRVATRRTDPSGLLAELTLA